MGPNVREKVGWAAAMTAALVAGWVTGRRLDAAAAVSDPAAPTFDWWTFVSQLYSRITDHRITAIAGGVTFFVLLALFPAVAALVSIYGLFADVAALTGQLAAMASVLPASTIDIIGEQLAHVIAQHNAALGFAFIAGVVLSLWSANAGIKALFDALNIIHDESETRSFIALNVRSLAFTVGLIFVFIVAIGAIVVLPAALAAVGLDGMTEMLLQITRWPVLFVAIALVLSLIYRFGPSCNDAHWRPITWGSAAAAFGWIVASMLFSWYAANFANFNKTYGTLGAAIGFMTWTWLVTIVILVGAEIDAVLARKPSTPLGSSRKAGP